MVGNGNGGSSKEGLLPHDVLINILKRVPVKSLIRFKCVSKDWAKLLETPYFIAQHLHHSSHNNNPFLLLQRIHGRPSTPSSCCLVAPDLTIHHIHFISSAHRIVASCNGLLCVPHPDHTLSLFNPATRQIKHLTQTLIDLKDFHYVGFGFSPLLNDYKIVRISVSGHNIEDFVILDDVRVNRAEVFSLSTGSWTEIDTVILRNLCLVSSSVTANGAIFWLATMAADHYPEFVVSFDMASQVFTLLKGPPRPYSHRNLLAVYNDKLAMFRHFIVGNYESCSIDLWVLEHTHTAAVTEESWIKMYSVRHHSGILYPLCIWRDEIVCNEELSGDGVVKTVLSLFNPYTNELKKLPAHRDEYSYFSFNYVESLVPVGNDHREQ